MGHIPTDLEILNSIYEHHYPDFQAYTVENKIRASKVYVPIDIKMLAKKLKVDNDIVFGRLYYHLNEKYGYKNDDGSHVYFFTPIAGDDRNCVNFPYLASVLADLREQSKKYATATSIAVLSLLLSIVSLLISIRI